MRKLQISLFSRAADATANRQTLAFEDLIEDFRAPEICEEPASEGTATALKLEAAAWSSGIFRDDHRSKDDFISASCLVYDLDDVPDLVDLLKRLELLRCCYAVHSTTRSGFKPHKLRVVLPLAHDCNAVEYDALWLQFKVKLGIEPDPTRRHPSGIYFAPVIFRDHLSSYIFECCLEGPYLGQVFSKKLEPRHDERFWLDSVRNATEKHAALNAAAYALAKLGVADAADKCLEALRENKVSAPVEDWGHARRTANKAVEDAGEPDPLVLQKEATEVLVSPVLSRTAEKRLMHFQKNVAAGGKVQSAAYELGRFVPHALDAESVTRAILAGWDKQKVKELSKPEAETEIALGIGHGMAAPIGVHDAWKEVLFFNSDGIGFAPTESNTQLTITNHPDLDGLVVWDVRQDAAMYLREPPWGGTIGRAADANKRELGPWVAQELGVNNISSNIAFDALLSRAQAYPHDVLLDYFAALSRANGTEILDRALIESAGAEDSLYTRLATRYWFVSVYARQVDPGCKADHAIILSGPQGIGKSTYFRTIFPPELAGLCSTEVIPEWDDKDCKITLSRFAVVELAELDQMSKNTVESVKKFLTEQRADVRPAFGRVANSYPRRAVFAGTTNKETDFLVDASGNRRFWPITVGDFDTTWNEKYRDLLWAQARYVYETSKRWWPEGEEVELFKAVQNQAVQAESFQDDLLAILTKPINGKQWKSRGSSDNGDGLAVLEEDQKIGESLSYVTAKQLAAILDLDHNNVSQLGRLKRALTIEGWKEERLRIGGARKRVWTRKR